MMKHLFSIGALIIGLTLVAGHADAARVEAEALKLEAVARELNGRAPKKVIIVPKRIVNVVV